MKLRRVYFKGYLATALALTIAGCTPLQDSHGYVPEPSTLADVAVGRDTRDTVGLLIGAPGAIGLVDTSGWYYVRSDFERFLWRAPVETNRQVVVVSFSSEGVVSNIERFGLENGRIVALSRRVTDDNTAGVGFLRQLFSNFGTFDAGSLLGGDT